MSLQFQIIPVTSYQQNCSLLWCTETMSGCVIDPGGDVEAITAVIEQNKVQLEKILLTHGHLDHVGGTQLLAKQHDVPVFGPHKADLFWLETLPNQAQMFGFNHVDTFVPNQWLNEGEMLEVGNESISVIHCPGHTPGHVVFYHNNNQLAFVGDVLFHGSIGRTDFPKGNYETLMDSIFSKLLPLGDEVRFVPGHGPMSTLGEERISNPFLQDKNK